MSTTGERIRAARLAAGMTQNELAQKVGVKFAAIHKYEAGLIVNLKRDTIAKLAEALNVKPSFLLCIDDETPAETGERQVTDDEIKFALFGTTDIDDDVYEDVKALARTAAEQAAKRKRKKEE